MVHKIFIKYKFGTVAVCQCMCVILYCSNFDYHKPFLVNILNANAMCVLIHIMLCAIFRILFVNFDTYRYIVEVET